MYMLRKKMRSASENDDLFPPPLNRMPLLTIINIISITILMMNIGTLKRDSSCSWGVMAQQIDDSYNSNNNNISSNMTNYDSDNIIMSNENDDDDDITSVEWFQAYTLDDLKLAIESRATNISIERDIVMEMPLYDYPLKWEVTVRGIAIIVIIVMIIIVIIVFIFLLYCYCNY